MNKPYFTKYIDTPIEKVGKPYTTEDGLITMQAAIIDLSPAKLFLCSRDIQVGDTVKMDFYAGEKDVLCNNIGMATAARHNGSYKVIGEVSPNAIWVKEGMEFDEPNEGFYRGDFQVLPIYGDDKNVTFLGSAKQLRAVINNTPPRELRVLFKCPTCNTFH